jgi:hypothetical protein
VAKESRVTVEDNHVFLRHRVAEDSRGTTVIEFALILPIFILLVFGIFEFGFRANQLNSIRTGSAEGARAAAVGAYGGDTSCTSPGLPGNSPAAQIVCLTKDRVALDEDKVRVAVALPSGYAVGEEVVVCVQYRVESVTGVANFIPGSDISFAKASIRVDRIVEENPLTAGSEAPLDGSDWSGCT